MSDVARPCTPAGHRRAFVAGLALALGAFAYRGLFQDASALPTSGSFEQWFFAPDRGRPLLPIAIALWMLLRRRARLGVLPDRAAPALAGALLGAGVLLFAWGAHAGARGLLPLSLAANVLSLAAATKGRAGCRAALLPALVILLATPVPAPLRDEITWQLQVSSARGATWLMQAVGVDVVLRGVVIHRADYAFSVIETCSGLRGIEILTLVALAVRELFAASGARSWVVVAVAPCLAYALNVLRIVVVVALTGSAGAEAGAPEGWDHTPQGVAVLAAGTALLYFVAHALAGAARVRVPDAERRGEAGRSGPATRSVLRAGTLGVVAMLAALSWAPVPLTPQPAFPQIGLPVQRGEWIGEDLPLDRAFVGQFLPGQVLHRRYEMKMRGGPPRVVEILVGYEDGGNPASRLFSPKLVLPGHDWSVADARSARLWLLGLDSRLTLVARDSELALGYLWRLRDRGLWREIWRATWELDAGPLRREPPRAVVRLLTPLANEGPAARERAKRTLDRFVRDFRDELARL